MKYKVLRNKDLNELEQEVNEHLENNWMLQGGITCSSEMFTDCEGKNQITELTYYQAITK